VKTWWAQQDSNLRPADYEFAGTLCVPVLSCPHGGIYKPNVMLLNAG